MKISIITVAFNSEKTISRTIESVLNQTITPYEYIIVDGASSDQTVKIAKKYLELFEKKNIIYTIISEVDKGIYDAMNKGISMSHGDLIGMINSDDWYELNALEVIEKEYEKKKFDIIYANLNIIRHDGKIIVKKAKLRKYLTSRDWNHPTTFIKRKIYSVYQYNINNLVADWELMVKVRNDGYNICIINQVLANFTLDGTSHEKNIKKVIKRIILKYKVYRNNGYSRFYLFECILIESAKVILG